MRGRLSKLTCFGLALLFSVLAQGAQAQEAYFASSDAKSDKVVAEERKAPNDATTKDKEAVKDKQDKGKEEKEEIVDREAYLQKGKLIDKVYGDVDGDKEEEEVSLMGTALLPHNGYMGDLYVLVRTPGVKSIKQYIRPVDLAGYAGNLQLVDVLGNSAKAVIISVASGGTSGSSEYRIVSFAGEKPKEIFTHEDNKGLSMEGEYLPDFQAKLSFTAAKIVTTVDLVRNKETLINLGLYAEDGTVKPTGIKPTISALNGLLVRDADADGVQEVLITQPVWGMNPEDRLGYAYATLKYKAEKWEVIEAGFKAQVGESKEKLEPQVLKGKELLISSTRVKTAEGEFLYPHILGMKDRLLMWKINSALDSFVAEQLAPEKGVTSLKFKVRHIGKNAISFHCTGYMTVEGRPEYFATGICLDIVAGKVLLLKDLVRSEKDFYAYVAKWAEKKALSITQDTLGGFYTNGLALTLLDSKGRELFLYDAQLEQHIKGSKLGKEIIANREKRLKELKDKLKQEREAKAKEAKEKAEAAKQDKAKLEAKLPPAKELTEAEEKAQDKKRQENVDAALLGPNKQK